MAEHHYVDPGDQHDAAEGIPDHSDLTTFYADVKQEDLGPWMQEADRQKALEAERKKAHMGLRKSAVLIGLNTSVPVVLGILLGQYAMVNADINEAGGLVFVLIVLSLGFVILTITLLVWVRRRFQEYSIRALPITSTTLISLFLVIQPLFDLFDRELGGLIGYSVALGSLLIVSIVISVVTIFAWTSPKLHPTVKLLVLIVTLGGAVAIQYLS